MPDKRTYFAAADAEDIGGELMAKIENIRASDSVLQGQADLYARAGLTYFGQDPSSGATSDRVSRGGNQGELALIRVNQARSMVQTLLSLILSAKVVWETQASNTDFKSVADAILANSILEQYWKDYQLASFAARALEEAIVYGDGFVYAPWDGSLGEDFAPGVKTGDFDFQNVSTWNVIRDPYKRGYDRLDWVIVQVQENRFTLAAKAAERVIADGGTPEDAEKASDAVLTASEAMIDGSGTRQLTADRDDTDDVVVYHFYHKRTAAMPQGREVRLLNEDVILEDGPLTYENIPLYRVRAADLFGTPYAYTPFFDILGPQELVDSLQTCIATNQTTFGTQMVSAPHGTDISPESFGGMKILTYPGGTGNKPEALQLTKSPPEVFGHLKDMVKNMEQLMGLNSVVRGEANSGEQSGSALALLSNQAKQQSSPLEGDFYKMLRSLGGGILSTTHRKCPFPRKVAIVGKANKSLVQMTEYNPRETLGRIHTVNVDIGNPLAQTTAGRKELADMYLQTLGPGKMLPEQIEQVITTGRLEPLTQGLQKQLLLILHENERIREGVTPPVLADDDHALHMRGHVEEAANPEVRDDPTKLNALNEHLTWHWQEYQMADPARLMVLGQQPPPVLGPPPGAPGAPPPPGGPDAPPGPPPGPEAPAQMAPPNPEQPPLPELPVDKSTGERVEPAGPPTMA